MNIAEKLKNLLYYIRFGGKITNLTLAKVEYVQLLKDKRILITGGGDGIGLSMAQKFISLGANVLITGRSEEKLQNASTIINSDRLFTQRWDITDFEGMKTSFHTAAKQLGGVDILVNNAGYLAHRSNLTDYFDKMIETNVKGTYMMCKTAVDFFLQDTDRLHKIINISSSNSLKDDTNAYTLSKKSVNAITLGFAKEYADRNIIVNAIAPGYVNASINKKDIEENAYDSRSRIHRIITPEDVAELATFLCSDASNAIVGQIIGVDGGVYLKL